MPNDIQHELPTTVPSPDELARAGGSKGATILRRGRSGDQAIQDWQKEHGNIEESALDRKRKREVGEE